MTTSIEAFAKVEQDLLRDRFAEFERGVLQDNIILCDGKSGVLLAFDGAMIVFCVDNLVHLQRSLANFAWWSEIPVALFLAAALGFLVSCHFALMTVVPRIHRGRPDHIFWEAPVFRLPEDQYVRTMRELDVSTGWTDKLRHLHLLAGICRDKFGHFHLAIRIGRIAFLVLVLGQLARVVI